MATAVGGYGTILKRKANSGSTFNTIAAIEDHDLPEISVATDDITNHNGNKWRKKLNTQLKELGEFKLTITWDPGDTTHEQLWDDMLAGTETDYQLVYPSAGGTEVWQFVASVTKFKLASPKEGALRADVTFTPSEELTVNPT